MKDHTLTAKEIMTLSAGRILNTFIAEYVLNEHPTRWSTGQQKELVCHWFEEHPRSCAEDDGGYCSADSLPNYSGDPSFALSLANASVFKDKPLQTYVATNTESKTPFWATFSNVPYGDVGFRWKHVWVDGETLAVAICRAALLAVI